MKKKIIIIILLLALVGLAGFFIFEKSSQSLPNYNIESGKMMVATSFYPLYFFTSQIGGDLVDVFNLTPAGSEPHEYELTSGDMIKIKKSRMLVLNGGLEVWADDVKENIKDDNIFVLTAGDGLLDNSQNEFGETVKDPHIWLSPSLAIKISEKIYKGLVQVDPKNQNYYESNLDILKTKLNNLENEFSQGLANCRKKEFVTSHKAFAYLAKEFGLYQMSIAGLSTEEEPSLKQMAEIAQFVRDNDIKYIFFESLGNTELTQTIANETGAQALVLNPIEGLTDSELSQGKDYFSEMRANLENLKLALECE